MCRSKKKISSINRTLPAEQLDKRFYIGTVLDNKELWSVTHPLNGRSIISYLDTGTEVMVISEKAYANIGSPELKTMDKTLKGLSSDRLDVRDASWDTCRRAACT